MAYTPDPTDITNPTDAISAETAAAEFRALKQYIQGIVAAGDTMFASGFQNKFRNAGFQVAQRGTTINFAASSSGYCLDGWIGITNGASAQYTQATSLSTFGTHPGGHVLGIFAASGMLAHYIEQNIESYQSELLRNQTVTCQFDVFLPQAGFPAITIGYPSVKDNFNVVNTGVVNQSFTVPALTWTNIAVTFNAGTAAFDNGMFATIAFGALSGQHYVANADIRVTPGIATGINLASPRPEIRSIAYETQDAQRYYRRYGSVTANADNPVMIGIGKSTSSVDIVIPLIIAMRAAPTLDLTHCNAANDMGVTTSTGSFVSINASGGLLLGQNAKQINLRVALTGAVINQSGTYWVDFNVNSAYFEVSAEL